MPSIDVWAELVAASTEILDERMSGTNYPAVPNSARSPTIKISS